MGELKTKLAHTFIADIYIAGKAPDVRRVCIEYVERGACVSIFPCEYIHTDGDEDGFMVRLINYPRFPQNEDDIEKNAIQLAKDLIRGCHQLSATVVCPSGFSKYIYDEEKENILNNNKKEE